MAIKRPELASFPVLSLVLVAALFAWIAIYQEFRAPEIEKFSRIYDISFILIPAVFLLAIAPKVIQRILFGDSLTLKDSIGDGLTGIGVGLLLTIFFLAPFGFRAIASAVGLPFGVMATCAVALDASLKQAGPDWCARSFDLLATQADPVPQLFTVAIINYFKVAFGEEFLTSIVRIVSVQYFTQRLGGFTGVAVGFGATGAFFAGLHKFAYAGLETGAYMAAFIGSLVFTLLLFWRGFYSAVAAHGTYNFALYVLTKAGILDVFGTYQALAAFIVIVIAGLIYINEQKRPHARMAFG